MEIAARTTIAIKIGTSGEDELSSSALAVFSPRLTTGLFSPMLPAAPFEPFWGCPPLPAGAWLPWPVWEPPPCEPLPLPEPPLWVFEIPAFGPPPLPPPLW